MKKLIINFAFLTLFWAGCMGCTVPEEEAQSGSGGLTLMTWNVHNLFNGVDDGFEYDEFRQASGWSQEKYLDRLNSISQAITELHKKPDIIMLQEIESLVILEDLAASLPSSWGFSWSHFAGNHGAATGVGLISRLPLGESANSIRTHSITVGSDTSGSETSPRPVLEVRIDDSQGADTGESFVIFVCHWKSKLGGDDATELLRRASAKVILRRIRELREEEPGLGFIVAGDLNINHDDFYRRGANTITALIPDDPYCAQLLESESAGEQKDYFVLSRNKPPEPVNFSDDSIVFFSPWMGGDLENGSYYYAYNWETIDHFLLSSQFFNGNGWEYEQAAVINYAPFANANGIPAGYNTRTGKGLSDHLPLIITLSKITFSKH